ncbi:MULTISPECIES: lipopolysaccharide assembly protein LapB [unclassified Bacteroides]|jgi:tetratricopeptide (TPR) repeat protein|uniref:tetratricopeptide repeat protein n=1 Tax=unclassified Bacteroides TaxID=2646097 RepID=UPI000E7DF34C|nr:MULTISPECIES: tetratricopeptide repeat protein [unclassified Bacteroides]RGN50238.1 tetratricopeptide repeat protein [Bacteroides sp. OM05-12]RHR75898.1 tetratricopeptide repeat protein [Bacteroides sp. AF16-49]
MGKVILYFVLFASSIMSFAHDGNLYGKLSRQWNNVPSDMLCEQADSTYKQQDYDTAFILYSLLYTRNKENTDEYSKQFCIRSCLQLGHICYSRKDYANALDFFMNGLKICQNSTDQSSFRDFYLNIGSIYCTFHDYEKGIEYYKLGYEWCSKYPDEQYEYKLLCNLAGAYSLLKKKEEARKYYSHMEKLTVAEDSIKTYMNLLLHGMILAGENKYVDAIHLFRESVGIVQKHQLDPKYESTSYFQLYHAYQYLNQLDSMLFYIGKCQQIAEQNHLINDQIENLNVYSKLYEMLDNPSKALWYKKQYLSLSDSVLKTIESYKTWNTQRLFEIKKEEEKIITGSPISSKKEAESHYSKILWFIGAFLFIAGLLVIIIFLQRKHLIETYNNISRAEQKLTETKNSINDIQLKFKENSDEVYEK